MDCKLSRNGVIEIIVTHFWENKEQLQIQGNINAIADMVQAGLKNSSLELSAYPHFFVYYKT